MSDPGVTRAVVILREAPSASTLMTVHRVLGLGLAEIRHRVATGAALVDVALFGNDHVEVDRLLRTLLRELDGLDLAVHVCVGDDEPGPDSHETPETLRSILDAHESRSLPDPALIPEPVTELVDVIAPAVRRAVAGLHAEHSADFCVYALVTTGEALRPYLTATVHGVNPWDLAEGPYAIVGDEWLAMTEPAFAARGDLHQMDAATADREYWARLASMEAALCRLDDEGLFGTGTEREWVLLLVTTMPPDETDAEFARRLNPPGPLLDAWLAEAAEGA